MTEYTAMTVIMFLKSLAVLAAVLGAIYLAYYEKPGWGWMIFLAIALGSSSVRLGSDSGPTEETKTVVER